VRRFRLTLGLRLRILAVAMIPLMVGVGLFAAYFTHRLVSEAERELEALGVEAAHHLGEAAAFDLSSGNLPNVKRLLDFDRAAREIPVIAITDGQRWLLISGDTSALPDLNGVRRRPSAGASAPCTISPIPSTQASPARRAPA
jgi:hypothetical protein